MVVRKRLQITGPALAFITTTIKDWIPVFNEPVVTVMAIKQLGETMHFHDAKIAGYVVMPHHIHLLLGFRRIEDMSIAIQAFKSLSSRRIKEVMSASAVRLFQGSIPRSIWKPRFDDLIVWSKEQFTVKLEYIHNNPVKAGLVDVAENYPYSSASCWLRGDSGLIEIDKAWSWTK